MWLPPQDALKLVGALPGSPEALDGNFLIFCNSTAKVALNFNSTSFEILPKDYVGSPTSIEGVCYSNIRGSGPNNSDIWVLGDTFLRNVYTAFDFDNNQVCLQQITY
jgi:cathepsin D